MLSTDRLKLKQSSRQDKTEVEKPLNGNGAFVSGRTARMTASESGKSNGA